MISWRKSQEGWKIVNGRTMFQQSDQRWRGLAEASRGAGQVAPEAEWVSSGSLAWLSYQDHLPPIPGWSRGPDCDETGRKWVTGCVVYGHENKWLLGATIDGWAFSTRQTCLVFPWKTALLAKEGNLGADDTTGLCLLAHEGAGFQSQVTQ